MQPVNVLVGKMQPILLGIVRDVISRHPEAEIVGEGIAQHALVDAARNRHADVVILASRHFIRAEELELLTCGGGARVRVVTLDPDHKSARRHELVEQVETIIDPSPDSLGDAILADLSPRWAKARG